MNSKKKGNAIGTGTLIYIDANIYLRFFDSNQPNFKKLLKTLIQLKDSILVTTQIVNEVNRNKGQVFERSFVSYIKQASDAFNNIQLPEHLDEEEDGKLKNWNIRRNKLRTENDVLVKELKSIYSDIFKNIYLSQDEVSKDLNRLFYKSSSENDLIYEKAKKRKEIGNPPGKKDDTLGDQINWEQLLNVIPEIEALYIISNDYDYFIKINDEIYLNPFLAEEIKLINPAINIYCFDKLINALKSLKNDVEDRPLVIPKESVIEKILIEELDNDTSYDSEFGKTIYYNSNYQDYKIKSELARLDYMYRHAMLSKDELKNRLSVLTIAESKIKEILKTGRINITDF